VTFALACVELKFNSIDMLKTKRRQEYASLSGDVIEIRPTAATQLYYNSLGHPEWGTPQKVTNMTGYPLVRDEIFRGEEVYRRNTWNDCDHYESRFEPEDVNGHRFLWCSPTTETPSRWWEGTGRTKYLINAFFDYMHPTLLGPVLYQPQPDGSFVLLPPGLDALKLRGYNAMVPHIKSEISLLNFFYELKDFRSLGRTLDKMLRTWELLKAVPKALTSGIFRKRSRLGRGFSVSWGNTLQEIIRGGADGYLFSQFAIAPLFSDIVNIQKALSRVKRSISDLVARQGRIQKRHFTFRWSPYATEEPLRETLNTRPFDQIVSEGDSDSVYYGTSDSLEIVSYIPASTATFHAQMEYSYSFTGLQTEYAQVAGLLDALGVNLNPAIIWNAIPFTFLIDWVVDVSQWLSQRTILTLEPVVNVSKFLWSYSYDRQIRRNIAGYNLRTGGFGPQQLPTVYQRAYTRRVELPDKSSLYLSGLTPKQVSLGVALAITRRKRRPKR
jgi:hypothetical protein